MRNPASVGIYSLLSQSHSRIMAQPIQPPGPLRSGLRIIDFNLTPPSNPPNAKDVANAVFYAKAITNSQGKRWAQSLPQFTMTYVAPSKTPGLGSAITDEEVTEAVEYQARVISAKDTGSSIVATAPCIT